MKIALCLSGQPRGIPLSCNFLQKYIIKPNQITDVFLHAWHDETLVGQPYNSAQPNQNGRVGKVKPYTQEILLEFFKPKLSLIEPQKSFPHLRGLRAHHTANQELLGSNFYSVWQANELKKQYEQEQGFIYDAVIRARYDLFYHHMIRVADYEEHLNKIVVMEKFQNDQDAKNSKDLPMPDIFSLSSSGNMDIFSSVYPNFAQLNAAVEIPFGENLLGQWVRVQNEIEVYRAPWKFDILHRVVDINHT